MSNNISLASDAQNMYRDQFIWSTAMLIHELSTFQATMPLTNIAQLNANGYYNIVMVTYNSDNMIISRTSVCEKMFIITKEYYLNSTVYDLISDVTSGLVDIAESARFIKK